MLATETVALIYTADQRRLLDQWIDKKSQRIIYCHDIDDCMERLSSMSVGIVFVGWNGLAPSDSAKALSLIKSSADAESFIVVISNDESENSIVGALELGADRFICQHTSATIVNAYFDAINRRVVPPSQVKTFHPYRLDLRNNAVLFGDKRVVLGDIEFRLAEFLFEHEGNALSREYLFEHVWQKSAPHNQNLRRVDTQISLLRKKLILDGTYGWRLEILRGQGYRLSKLLEDVERDPTGAQSE